MKRLVLALSMSLVSGLAWADACDTVSACATTPCDFNVTASWENCGGSSPSAANDTVTVEAGASVVLDADAIATGAWTINGTLSFQDSSTGRDANGFRTITITCAAGNDITIGAAGRLQLRESDRIFFDSSAATCEISVTSGGVLDVEGVGWQTTIKSGTTVTAVDADGSNCGADVAGRKWTFTVADGEEWAKAGGRVRFLTGEARNREFEIYSVSGTSVAVCTDYDDGDSANRECSALSTPYACCSGLGAGTCTIGQRLTGHITVGALGERHSVPTVNDETAANYIEPVAGDQLLIINDAHFGQIAGTNGYRFTGGASSGNNPLPVLRWVNFPGVGTSGNAAIFFLPTTLGQAFQPYEGLNIHDYVASSGFTFQGLQNGYVRYNTCHDAASGATGNGGCIQITPALAASGATVDMPLDGLNVTDNTIYRSFGNGLQFNASSSTVFATGAKVQRNLGFDGCTRASGECGIFEVVACQSCDISWNVAYDACTTGGASGGLYRGGGTGSLTISDKTVFHHNWGVNGCGTGMELANSTSGGQGVTATANYLSHVRLDGGQGGRWFGDVIRNYGLDDGGSQSALVNPIVVKSVWTLGNDPSIADGGSCATGCAKDGIYLDSGSVGNQNQTAVTIQDFFGGYSDVIGGRAIVADNNTDFNVTISNVTCDGDGLLTRCVTINAAPTSAITVSLTDIAATHLNNNQAIVCTTDAEVTDSVATLYYNSSFTADGGAVLSASTNCASYTGATAVPGLQFADRGNGNYNWNKGASALTGGSGGGPVGMRAFRNPAASINHIWGGVLPFDGIQPADITNASNTDTDADGVIDTHDNCDMTFNPSQYDTDADGKGDACDA